MSAPIDDAWTVAVSEADATFDSSAAESERAAVERLFDTESPHQFRDLGTVSFDGDIVIGDRMAGTRGGRNDDWRDLATTLPLSVVGDAKVFGFMGHDHPYDVLLRWSNRRPTQWFRPTAAESSEDDEFLMSATTVEASRSDESLPAMLEAAWEADQVHVADLDSHGSLLRLRTDGTGRGEWLVGTHEGAPVALFTALDRDNTTYTVRPSAEDGALLARFRNAASMVDDGDRFAEELEGVEVELKHSDGVITPEIRGALHLLVSQYVD